MTTIVTSPCGFALNPIGTINIIKIQSAINTMVYDTNGNRGFDILGNKAHQLCNKKSAKFEIDIKSVIIFNMHNFHFHCFYFVLEL